MRPIFYVIPCMLIVLLGYWAYKENYQTQASLSRVKALKASIAEETQIVATLKAEWAYLNRPERLRELVELNHEVLQLDELTGGHFADIDQLRYPPIKPMNETGITDLRANSEDEE